jgi:coronin-1B/1C/6
MSKQIVRASKYRHVYGQEVKKEQSYTELRTNISAWDSNFVACSNEFFAIPWAGGGGSLAVISYSDIGRKSAETPVLSGHSGQILDFAFNPFNDYIIASGSADCTVKIWGIPEGGLTKTITEPLLTLEDHTKKVGNVLFHPTASNVLFTAAMDHKINLWDIETGKIQRAVNNVFGDAIQSMVFNKDGSQLAVTSKDKKFRLMDPRLDNPVIAEAEGHQGTKGSRACWLTSIDKILTVGFTKLSQRHYMIWDPRNLSAPVKTEDVDMSAGLIMPFFDHDTSIVYLAGKGDGNIRFYEVVDDSEVLYSIGEYKSTSPQRGMGMVPKLQMNVVPDCEVTRLLKLENTSVTPISFTVPRKSELFQEDIYPDTFAPEATQTAEEYFNGGNAEPRLVSMNPKSSNQFKKTVSTFVPKVEAKQPKTELPKKVSNPKELMEQNEQLRLRVEALEKENWELKQQLAQQQE